MADAGRAHFRAAYTGEIRFWRAYDTISMGRFHAYVPSPIIAAQSIAISFQQLPLVALSRVSLCYHYRASRFLSAMLFRHSRLIIERLMIGFAEGFYLFNI